MDIYVVRTGLADAASSVVLPSVNNIKLTCLPYLPDSVTEPMFFVAEYDIDFDGAMNRKFDTINFTCRVLVGKGDDQSSQKLLDSMFSGSGSASLKTAIESDRTQHGGTALGGACSDFIVTKMQGNRWYEHAGNHYLGGEIMVKVIGSGG